MLALSVELQVLAEWMTPRQPPPASREHYLVFFGPFTERESTCGPQTGNHDSQNTAPRSARTPESQRLSRATIPVVESFFSHEQDLRLKRPHLSIGPTIPRIVAADKRLCSLLLGDSFSEIKIVKLTKNFFVTVHGGKLYSITKTSHVE